MLTRFRLVIHGNLSLNGLNSDVCLKSFLKCVICEYLVEALSMLADVHDLDKHGVCWNFVIIDGMHTDCFLKELQMLDFELGEAMTACR
ncbi:hypothetical protein Scep_026401 [Stephania cephalantha]|uniref:Uncharacterized protein n=1 Tax=Stephania cephalantha TaxID=152367 RepID=A0AAP0HS12_9MAGN